MVRTKQTIETIVISVVSLGCLMVSKKDLENQVRALNRIYGFKGREYVKYKSKKGYKLTGSGFGLYFAYGKAQLVFQPKGTSGIRTISPLGTKREIQSYIGAMKEGKRYWQDRAKLK